MLAPPRLVSASAMSFGRPIDSQAADKAIKESIAAAGVLLGTGWSDAVEGESDGSTTAANSQRSS